MRFKSSRAVALAFAALLMLTPPAAAAQSVPDPAAVAAEQAAANARQAACSPVAADGDQATAATRAGIPVTVQGTGQSQSLPFSLGGGAYTVAWSMTEPSTLTSFIHLDVAELLPGETELQARLRESVILNGNGKDGSAGENHLYYVKPGRYYLSVRAPSGWSVTFTPLAV